jgi:predicted phage terminase large subunit-like protein
LTGVLRKRLDFYKIEPAIISMKQKYNATGVILEISGVGKAIGNSILRHENSRRWFCWIEPQEGKVDRATAQTPKLERKYIYLPETADWLETFEAEIAEFPFCKYFDQVDSMLSRRVGRTQPHHKPPQRLSREVQGGVRVHLKVDRPNQVCAMDITYIPMARGFVYHLARRSSPLSGGKSHLSLRPVFRSHL